MKKEIQHRLSNLVRTIGEMCERNDSPEEVMDLLEVLVPLTEEVLKAEKHGKEDLS